MEKQRPLAAPADFVKSAGESAPGGVAPSNETTGLQNTATRDEYDPLWKELGSTQVVERQSDSSVSSALIHLPSNFTEISPSRVLGKNLLKIGDFQLLRKLGEGAMGAVYKAKQISFDRVVALKVLFPHVADNPKLVARLEREARVMFHLDHPNIVLSFGFGEADGCHFVAMQYVSGQNTQKWLSRLGRLPVADAVRIALDCAKALAYAHAQNIIHRDIKPDNILLTRTGVVKVADFGMAKTHDEDMSLTQTGHAVGTPWFMPLEQARNAKEIDGRSDIYALGCTLYAFLTGQPPFVGRTIVDVIQAKEIGSFPPARQSNAEVPERLDLILAKMTAKSARYRYQTCDEVIKDLESLNLASDTLSFIRQKPSEHCALDTPAPGKTSMMPTAVRSKVDIDFGSAAAPSHDPDLWYVQAKGMDGAVSARTYTTAQLQIMLEEGAMAPTVRASHNPDDGFRALGTYKEFQGATLGKMTKQAADKNTARYRGIYKKLEKEDREREEKERQEQSRETPIHANTRYWLDWLFRVWPYALGVAAFVAFLVLLKWLMD